MNWNKVLPWLVVGYAAYWFYSQSGRFDIGGATISRLKLESGGIRVNIKLSILNRSAITAKIQSFLGQLFYGSNALGTVTLIAPMEIPSNAVSEPEFTTVLSYTSIGMEVWAFLQNRLLGSTTETKDASGKPIKWEDFRIMGTLSVSDVSIDLDEKIFA